MNTMNTGFGGASYHDKRDWFGRVPQQYSQYSQYSYKPQTVVCNLCPSSAPLPYFRKLSPATQTKSIISFIRSLIRAP